MCAGAVILGTLAVWRLNQDEPLRLTFLTPYLEQALSPADAGFAVHIDDTILTWAGWDRTFDLRASGVHVIADDGQVIAEVPAIALTLSVRALLTHGLIAPTTVEVLGPHVFLLRGEDGRFQFIKQTDLAVPQPKIELSPVIPALLQTLLRVPDPTLPTGYLKRANLVSGQLTVIDNLGHLTWFAPNASAYLTRDANGIGGQASMSVERLGDPAKLNVNLTYDSVARDLAVTGDFTDVNAAAIGLMEPSLKVLTGVNIKLAGKFSTALNLDGRLGDTRFDFNGSLGQIVLPNEFSAPVPIRLLAVTGGLDSAGERLTIDEAVLQFDGPRITASGTLSDLRSALRPQSAGLLLEAHGTIDGVQVGELSRYWPRNVGRNPRAWVTENMLSGQITEAEADLRLRIPIAAAGDTIVELLEGTLQGKALAVSYLKPMPPIEAVDGSAHFTADEFIADFGPGKVKNVAIKGGQLRITGIGKPEPDERIDIDAEVEGKLFDIMKLLDNPRLGYAKKLGVKADEFGGETTTKLSLGFPTVHDVSLDVMDLKVESDIRGGSVAKAVLGQDMTDADLKLSVDKHAMHLEGTAKVVGAPVALSWDENFDKADFIRRLSVNTVMTAAQRAALGFDFRPELDDSIKSDIVYTQLPKGRATIDLKLDLTPAIISLPMAGWRKEASVPGSASMVVELNKGRAVALNNIAVDAGDLRATGRIDFAEDGETLRSATFDHLTVGLTDLHNITADIVGKRTDIVIGGGKLDAEPLINKGQGNEKTPEKTKDSSRPPFTLKAQRLDSVRLAEGRELQNVSIELQHDGEYWDVIAADAALPAGATVSLSYRPDGGVHKLKIESLDAGSTLRMLDVIETVKGGHLLVSGEANDATADRPLKGHANITDFRLVGATTLGRILTMATLTGFVDVATGEGYQFDKLVADFVKTNEILDIELARAHGPTIGVTAAGTVNFDKDTLDLKGTVVPAYAVNSFIGKIPLIGEWIVGGKDQGLFSATYHVTGPVADPEISVNPLAALTPGFLRGLFDIFDGDKPPPPIGALPDSGTTK